MFTTPEQFAAANKASVDAMLSLANTALASAERIAALNLNTAHTLLEDGMANAKALLGARNPEEAMNLVAAQLKPAVEEAVSYTRSLYEISAQSREDLSRQLESQFRDFQKRVSGLLDMAAQNAPAGSDAAIAAVRSALEAASSAFGHMKTVLKQAAEIDEASIASASNATVNAVSSATPRKKK
ncbi:phasin family protein [Propionivibrio sp.]|uniref:phasin family protein n=1 Tax=Propionivibrio sp. TaxID=2212460 RepID=UPI0026356F90|nr:phasin family protein [Propionivibrio sp.]